MTGRMEGKVVLITGAARGQGRSHAVRLAQEGADIIAIDLCGPVPSVRYEMPSEVDLAETVRLVEGLGRRVMSFKADVRDLDALKAAIDEGVGTLGQLDGVAINHGITTFRLLEELDAEAWRDMVEINLTGVFHTAKAAVPHLEERGGAIVATSSSMTLRPAPAIAHYTAAKHGVVGLVKTLAIELGPKSIRVNSVHPTSTNTEMLQNQGLWDLVTGKAGGTREEAAPVLQSANALPIPWVEPVDISNAVLFLLSDEARYVTGVELPVDAGFQLT